MSKSSSRKCLKSYAIWEKENLPVGTTKGKFWPLFPQETQKLEANPDKQICYAFVCFVVQTVLGLFPFWVKPNFAAGILPQNCSSSPSHSQHSLVGFSLSVLAPSQGDADSNHPAHSRSEVVVLALHLQTASCHTPTATFTPVLWGLPMDYHAAQPHFRCFEVVSVPGTGWQSCLFGPWWNLTWQEQDLSFRALWLEHNYLLLCPGCPSWAVWVQSKTPKWSVSWLCLQHR